MKRKKNKSEICLPKITGIFHLDIFKDGEKISEERHNLIVDNSSKVLARLVGGATLGSFANLAINQIRFSDGNLPVGINKTDLDGTNKFTKSIDSVTYNVDTTPYDIQFNFSLGAAEFNGYGIWQFGLVTGDGVLFSMLSRNPDKTFPIEKDSSVTISGWWKLQFRNSA
jgi:hypothetical protein